MNDILSDFSNHLAKPFEVKTGLDGKKYAVFQNGYERDVFMENDALKRLNGFRSACFGQFDNAVCLEERIDVH